VTFLVAAHDEIDSLPTLVAEIDAVARDAGLDYEILVVDDGSEDGTGEWLDKEAAARANLRAVHHDGRRGQSVALGTGIDAARGLRLVTLDADLQNDPADAPALLAALDGADLACGVRVDRRDPWSKRIGSAFANAIRRCVLGDRYRDVGCTLKAWRREVAVAIPRPRNFHRYIPILAEHLGFRVVEHPVGHRSRRHGETHYRNLSRAWVGLFDLAHVSRELHRADAHGRRGVLH